MSSHPISAAADRTRRVHAVTAVCLVPVALFAFVVLGSWILAALIGVSAGGIVISGRRWYGRLAQCTDPAGTAVVTGVRHIAGVLAEIALDSATGSLRLMSWTSRAPRVGQSVELYGSPATGVFGAVCGPDVFLSAVPATSRAEATVTHPKTPRLSGGEGPRVGGRARAGESQ